MPNVTEPDPEALRAEAERTGTRTEFGNYLFSSNVRNRSAGSTVYVGGEEVRQSKLNPRQEEIVRNMPQTLGKVIEYLGKAPLYHLRMTMGDNPYFTPHCDMFASRHKKDFSRLPYMAMQTLFPRGEGPGPTMTLIDLPEWQEKDRQVLVFPEERVTVALGSDYYGEVKKAFLRMGMYSAKRSGMLGLHAGSKYLRASTSSGLRDLGMIIFGLTATGKTTHTCHDHYLDREGERVKIVQDDVVFLKRDGGALGTERGFYIKTDGLREETQPLLYQAATRPDAILDNGVIDHQGRMHFQDLTLTGNGRGIVQRDDLGDYKAKGLNLPSLEEMDSLLVAFITRRNTVLPIVSRLTPAQAAGAFMLGESIESSGGDPKRAGESVRVVGTNPFLIGSEEGEGNWFHRFLQENEGRVECYQLNTGGVGEIIERDRYGNRRIVQKVTRVEVPEMARIIRGICRGTIEWVEEPHFNTFVPREVEGVDLDRFELDRFYTEEQVDSMVRELKEERVEYLKAFPDLHEEIIRAYEP
ncbi:MAG: phosphoenolpyruvate carboxykinase [Methanomassiliicoccales archaeon]